MANTLKFGKGIWAIKKGSTLAYNDENGNFKPLPFNFTRSTSATRVNKDGLIEAVTNNKPRIDFLNNSNGALKLEPSRSNSFSYSEPIANSGSTSGISYESFIWSLGFTNCVKFGDNSAVRFRYGGSVLASTQYTVSAFVIMDDLSEPLVGNGSSVGDFSFVAGGIVGGVVNSNVYYGNNIYRVSTTLTSGSNLSNNGVIKYTTQSSKGFRITGFQLEQGSYATSYIPTQGATATRVAETCSDAGNNQVINSTEGVLYIETSALSNDLSERRFGISDGTSSNVVRVGYTNVSNRIIAVVYNGSNQAVLTYTLSDITQKHKIAVKYKENDFALWVNGVERSTDVSGSVFSANTLNSLDFNIGGGSHFYSDTKEVKIYNTALTDLQLQQLTTL